MIEALLFDFNGVLVDDEAQHCEALQEVLTDEGLPLSREAYYADFLGFDDRMCFVEAFRRANRTLTTEHLERLVVAKARAYRAAIDRSLTVVAGAPEFVRTAAASYRLGLVSGALREEIEAVLDRIALRPLFETIIAAEDVPRCKPDPAGFLAARATLDRRRPLPARRCVVIEDSLPGLEAARAAGMPCVMLSTSHAAEALRAGGADLVWTSFTGHAPAELAGLGNAV
ncbi:MAG TPA: HAD family phosphatase [Gemmatimonadales bacterium]